MVNPENYTRKMAKAEERRSINFDVLPKLVHLADCPRLEGRRERIPSGERGGGADREHRSGSDAFWAPKEIKPTEYLKKDGHLVLLKVLEARYPTPNVQEEASQYRA